MKFRFKHTDKGWIVEYKTFLSWKHVTHHRGLDEPYYYKTAEEARQGAIREVSERISFSY